MAVIANTFTTGSAVGNREELSDVVSRITPEDTPIYSLIEKGKCVSIHPEWETDDLATPGSNAHEEGEDYTFGTVTPPARLGDYTQIVRKDWIISGTQEEVSEAGNVQKRKYQRAKKGVEVRKDIEYAIVSNTASVGGTTRLLGGLPSWLITNVSRGGGAGANGGFNSTTGLTVAATNGTQRAYHQGHHGYCDADRLQFGRQSALHLRFVLRQVGVRHLHVGHQRGAVPLQRVVQWRKERHAGVGGLLRRAVRQGHVPAEPCPGRMRRAWRETPSSSIPTFVSFLWLRKIQDDKDVAKTGDADKGVIIGEGTLKVHNEKGLGVAADLYGLTSAS
jgi:hypothetical protein